MSKEEGASFLMAGGGTGGHVIPLLAVARELRLRGHRPFFAGTRRGLEAKLVPAEGFPIEWIDIGGLKNVGPATAARTLWRLPAEIVHAARMMRRLRTAAVFSLGGYVAGPVMLAAALRGVPVALMEANAMPGFTNRKAGRFVARALLGFPQAARYFPAGRTEVTGMPVRPEFFAIPPKPRGETLTVLVTGGSQGSRTLNRAVREAWPLLGRTPARIRLIHQTGAAAYPEISEAFARAGVEGEVVAFLDNMPAAYARADLLVCRAGAGTVAELAAAGKPSILVPFPYAADDHQTHNARVLAGAGAAALVPDREMTGERLMAEILAAAAPGRLERMGEAARRFARPGAAARAADLLEELGAGRWGHRGGAIS